MPYTVDVQTVPARSFAAVRFHATEEEMPKMMGEAFAAVMGYLGRAGIALAGAAVARFDSPPGDGFDVAAGFLVGAPVDGDGTVVSEELPAGEVAHVTHIGPYEDMRAAYEALRNGVGELGRALSDGEPMWEEYWSPPGTPPELNRTEIYWPVLPVT